MSKNTKTARFSRTISSSASRPARKLSLSTRSLAARCDPVAAVLLGPGCLHEQLHRRRDHKQQHGLRFCGEFQKFDISLPRIGVDETVSLQIVKSLQANLCHLGQVTRHRRQILRQERSFQQGLQLGIVIPPQLDRKSTRLNSSHSQISYAVFCLKKKKKHSD